MIDFVLPDYYYNFKIINFLVDLSQNPEFFRQPVHFSAASGQFPFSIWNGQYNIIQGTTYGGKYFPVKRDYECYKNLSIPIRLNCSNVCLEEDMFTDEHMNVILKCNDNMSNFIELSNLNLLDYIQAHYKYYRFVFSDNADLLYPFTPELIDKIISFDKFEKIKLPIRFNKDFDTLKVFQNKNKLELTVNSLCPIDCPSFANCHIKNDEAQTNFSELNVFNNCAKTADYIWSLENTISLDEIKEIYEPLGYHHFNFASIGSIDNSFNKILFFFNYFFKDEYIYQMLNTFNNTEGIFS